MILELGGRPPLERLQELAAALHGRDRELLAQGVHLGLVINESEAEPGQGDFLIRGLVGADAESGAVAVGGEVEVGQAVQFHVRDADSADEDLRRTLKREAAALGARPPAGALLFTCNGRGSRLFPGPDHDAGLLAETLGQIPVAGFFCAGRSGRWAAGTSCTRSPPRPPCSLSSSPRRCREAALSDPRLLSAPGRPARAPTARSRRP
jgi:small ligand-binding sensory domain FIST